MMTIFRKLKVPFSYRLLLWGVALAVGAWFAYDDPGGLQFKEQLRSMLGVLLALPVVYIGRRGLADMVRGRDLLPLIREGNVSAGLAYLGIRLLDVGLLLMIASKAPAAVLPPGAVTHLPILQQEIAARWPAMPMPSMLAALVEQESRWKVGATLKTSREEGVGLGQFTRAYTSDGRLRFDALAEVRRLDPSLASWTWEDRYNPRMQLRAITVKVRDCHFRMRRMGVDEYNSLAMCDSSYNGGEGDLMADRRLCGAVAGCNPKIWFKNVELYSRKSSVKWQGYGESPRSINRGHVRNVMIVLRPKYVAAMGA